MDSLKSSNLGYPRIGVNREWKKLLEALWANKIQESEFEKKIEELRLNHLKLQQEKGIDLIPVNDFSLYDHMLDTAAMFGIVPKRFNYPGGVVSLSTYYAMARGSKGAPACEMTKWFNTNYHYIVPELNDITPVLTINKPLQAYREAKQKLGIDGKPVLIGLYTFLKLSKGYKSGQWDELIALFLPLYAQILRELEQEGVRWVQIDEPVLVNSLSVEDMDRITHIYKQLHEAAPGLNIMLQTYFDAVEHYEATVSLPVQGIGLDLVHGYDRNMQHMAKHGFPKDKVLGAGLIDGRNIWAADLQFKLTLLNTLSQYVPYERMIIQPSCSLLHVPVTTGQETKLGSEIRQVLAFANEKLDEIVLLTKAVADKDSEPIARELEKNQQALREINASSSRKKEHIQEMVERIDQQPSARAGTFAERRILQQNKWNLPILPTTTIGSFPQTSEVRQARKKWRTGEWTEEQYKTFIQEQIRLWINLQEEIGLDVLVHGEFERTDMVEFFGEKLGGFFFTQNGWVQSYGSRCVKPPVIYGDVEFIKPMTVEETVYAQSLTNKPVKGMLTGPITILNWSFVRDDIPREKVAYQIALALRQEVEALEKAGIEMIQVDEPALREGLPIKRQDWQHYLDWAVLSFRLATATVKNTTQIHTHMCYCEFHDIIDSIRELDADVISIETSRSHGELLHSFEEHTYDHGIGLGVYDIHSPRVPDVKEMVHMIDRSLSVLDPELFWINPDCGLKTRGMDETIASLKNMVEAAKSFREKSPVLSSSL
ncbi:5-methyltetrahydropteroyltriglutamate--homocysteine S-methyltransferase [Paenibacillus naphthalenovorans]|uniref:5-methyltetrahydropteroyltriglutamate-- homocysteine S-methyltransferase n=1 Tax=Paenibacillus naphthalenovorans TaxID=162209 RepID=UPI0010B8D241|nr:5-methyltetrahydropteroyltriglutamate--homocysteine S-methyltransferase [Paenibacillus naphthalenovorans]GCL73175.1 5-methyltetrahydropteroyltriglutamate--homocysteine S-methyltransferase [Paenibacillus naphthalenovorans]